MYRSFLASVLPGCHWLHEHHCAAVMRLSLGRQLVNLLPVAQRTMNNALTNGFVDRPWVVGREFESHVHHENAF